MTRRLKIPKDLRPVVRQAVEDGWTLSQSRHGHPKLTAPDGSYATPVPTSTRSGRLIRSVIARIEGWSPGDNGHAIAPESSHQNGSDRAGGAA